jgi:hypothetical protein
LRESSIYGFRAASSRRVQQVTEKHLLLRLLKKEQMQGPRQFLSASGGPKSEAYLVVPRNDEE